MKFSFHPTGWRRGFSLIEIMVAVSLLALIIVGLLAMFYQVQKAFRTGTAQVDVMEGGRATMGIFTRELREIAPSQLEFATNLVILPAESAPLTAFTVQGFVSGDVRENILKDVCFLSRVNDDWVGIAYRLSNAVPGVATLYRMEQRLPVNSNPEFAAVDLYALSRFVCTNLPGYTPATFHPLLDGVVHLTFDAYDAAGRKYSNAFWPNPRMDLGYSFTNTYLPSYLDVELAILEPGAVEKFRARAETDLIRATNYLAKQIGRTHVFRQRVAVKAAQSAVAVASP